MGKRKLGKKRNNKNKKRKRNRPPRIFKTKDGRYYFKKRVRVKGKYKYRRVYIKTNLKNSELVKIIINNFQKKNRRLRSAINRKPNAKQRNGVNNPGIFSYGSSLDSEKQSPELVAKNALIDAVKNDKDKEYIKRIQNAVLGLTYTPSNGLTYTPTNGLTYTPSKNTKQQEDDAYDMEIYDDPTPGEITNANIKYALEPYEGETYLEKYRRMLKNAALLEGYNPEESQLIANNAIEMNQKMSEEINRQAVEAALKEQELRKIREEMIDLEKMASESKEKMNEELSKITEREARKRIKAESKKVQDIINTRQGSLSQQMEQIMNSLPDIDQTSPKKEKSKKKKKRTVKKIYISDPEMTDQIPKTLSLSIGNESKQSESKQPESKTKKASESKTKKPSESKTKKPSDEQAKDKRKKYDEFYNKLNTNKLRSILNDIDPKLKWSQDILNVDGTVKHKRIQNMKKYEIYPLLYAHMLKLDPVESDIFKKKLLKQLPKKTIKKEVLREFKLLIPEETPTITTAVTTPLDDLDFFGPPSQSKPSKPSQSKPSKPSQSLTAVGPSLEESSKRPKTIKVRRNTPTGVTDISLPLEDDVDELSPSVILEDSDSDEDGDPPKPQDGDITSEIPDGLSDDEDDDVVGKGKGKNKRGMTDRDIDRIMKKHSWYVGTFSLDEFPYIPIRNTPFSFIINTKNRNEPKIGHWVSIRIDPKDSIEYFDPLAEDPPNKIRKGIKNMINRIQPDVYLKFKINKIKHQAENTDTCGFHCIAELKNRSNGIDWKECTGWSEVRKSEKDVKKMKKKYGYI